MTTYVKRFVLFGAVCAGVFASAALAAEDETVTLLEESGGVVYTMQNDGAADTAVLALYDDGGKLIYADVSEYTDYRYDFDVPDDYTGGFARITYVGGDTYAAEILTAETTPAATEVPETTQNTESPSPAASATPAATPTATPAATKTPIPEVYPSASDARNAFAVIEDVSYTAESDGEYRYKTKMLYQGSEITTSIDETVLISSASDAYSYMVGQNAGALTAGDVIHFTTKLTGKMKTIEFIFRPTGEQYSIDDYGANYASLISASGSVAGQSGWKVASYGSGSSGKYTYAFGIPIKKTKGDILLSDSDGNTMYADIQNDTIVYTVTYGRNVECEISAKGQSGIGITGVPQDALDDNDNVTDLSCLEDANYVLVRMIDGTATDIVVFE